MRGQAFLVCPLQANLRAIVFGRLNHFYEETLSDRTQPHDVEKKKIERVGEVREKEKEVHMHIEKKPKHIRHGRLCALVFASEYGCKWWIRPNIGR